MISRWKLRAGLAARSALAGLGRAGPSTFISHGGSASWAAMTLGFGAVGAAQRRRRPLAAPQS